MQKFLENKKKYSARIIFAALTVFFFIFSPLSYFANTSLGVSINALAFIIATAILIIVLIFLNKNWGSLMLPKFFQTKTIIIENYPIFAALIIYFFIHALNFNFYVFIPEWDSYGDLININRILDLGFSDITYRPFFSMSNALLSTLTHINPYHIFSILFIIIQSVILLVAYEFLKIYQIKNKILQLFFLLGISSIPSLMMEIDMVRPQNIFIIFFPIYIYFLHDFLVERRMSSLILASLIAIFGQSYHEFFLFILLFHIAVFSIIGYKKYSRSELTPRKILPSVIILSGLIALLPKIAFKSPILTGLILTAKSASQRILDVEKWRIWFIGNYWNDNELLQMGWSGILGAAKYYAYYVSPFVLMLIILLVIILIIRNDFILLKNKVFSIAFSFFVIFFTFAEIFPRLNYHYLPERYWTFIDIAVIFMFIPALKYFEESQIKLRNALLVISLSLLLGVSGIFYVAHGKKALTSIHEYEATQWIKKNTPNNSVFVSQSANYPMIKYFSKREAFYPTESFFLGAEIEKEAQSEKFIEIEKAKNEIIVQLRTDFDAYIFGAINSNEFDLRFRENKNKLSRLQSNLEKQIPKITDPTYILYSTDKFNTIYNQRIWWRSSNFYGANLDKFDKNFKLVYQNKAVKIWQMQ